MGRSERRRNDDLRSRIGDRPIVTRCAWVERAAAVGARERSPWSNGLVRMGGIGEVALTAHQSRRAAVRGSDVKI